MSDKFGWQKATAKDAARRALRAKYEPRAKKKAKTAAEIAREPPPPRPSGWKIKRRKKKKQVTRATQSQHIGRLRVKLPAILPAGSSVTILSKGNRNAERARHLTKRDIVIVHVVETVSAQEVAARCCGKMIFMEVAQLLPIESGSELYAEATRRRFAQKGRTDAYMLTGEPQSA